MKYLVSFLIILLLINIVPMIVDKAMTPSIHKGDKISNGYVVHASTSVKKFLIIYVFVGLFLLLCSMAGIPTLMYFGIVYVFVGCLNTVMYYKNRICIMGDTIKFSWFLKQTKIYYFSEITKAEILYDGRLEVYQKEKKLFRVPPIYWGYTQFLNDLKVRNIPVYKGPAQNRNKEELKGFEND